MQGDVNVSAPGRICLFGEHQDYLGLPVVAAAVNLRISIRVARKLPRGGDSRDGGLLAVEMPDMGDSISIDTHLDQRYDHPRDYLRAAVNVLRRAGCAWEQNWSFVVRGGIPIGAGVSSSSALVVAWIRALLETASTSPAHNAEDVARWGFESEVGEFGEPGGMMDHYCAALGGLLAIDTRPPFRAEPVPNFLEGIVLVDSGEPKATLQTLGSTRRDVTDGIKRMRELLTGFDIASTPLADVEGLFKYLQPLPAKRLRANLVNRNITVEARDALARRDLVKVAHLLTLHHAQLRDGLDLSTPKIERLLAAAIGAGAIGGKINGSGGGGTLFVLAPGREGAVCDAIGREGGVPYRVKVDEGARQDPCADTRVMLLSGSTEVLPCPIRW